MFTVLSAILPVLLTIGVGQVCRQVNFPGPKFWHDLVRLNYFVLMPAFLIRTIATADLTGLPLLPFVGALLAALASMVALLVALRPMFGLSGPQFTSFFQAATRWNGFVALAVIAAIYGAPGLGPAGIVFAVYVPSVNIMTVILLTRQSPDGPPSFLHLLSILARNPLILGCIAGLILKATNIGLPGFLGGFVRILADPAVALGLLCVGAGLNPKSLGASRVHLVLAASLKLIAMPLLLFAWAKIFGITGVPFAVAVIAGTVPTAAASFVLSSELGGDAEFMASLITATTIGAAITMPIAIALLTGG